jgi:hypothetical protein
MIAEAPLKNPPTPFEKGGEGGFHPNMKMAPRAIPAFQEVLRRICE